MEEIEIRFKMIDPDTGNISQDKLVCRCEDERSANLVLNALHLYLAKYDDPNREFYKKQTSK